MYEATYLKFEINRTLRNINKYLDKLESYEFYSDNSKVVIKLYRDFIKILEDNFPTIPQNFYKFLLQQLNYRVIPLLRYLQRSQTSEIPWGLIPNIEKIISQLLGDNFVIIIRPQWHWNYAIIVSDITNYLNNLLENITKKSDLLIRKEKIHFISFPNLEKTNFILHSIIGHEVGHFYQDIYFETYITKHWEQQKVSELVLKFRDLPDVTNLFPSFSLDKIIRLAEETMLIYKGMIREIIPDIIGYLIFGPSSLFSLYTFSSWNNSLRKPSYSTDYYPPLKYRIRFLTENFFFDDVNKMTNSNKFKSKLNDFQNDLVKYLNVEDDMSIFSSSVELNFANELFLKTKNQMLDFCMKEIGDKRYIMNSDRVNILINKIENTIPPNEIESKPVELAEVFLAGWVYYYSDYLDNKNLNNNDDLDKFKVLTKLLLKASNSLFIHQYFEENRGNA